MSGSGAPRTAPPQKTSTSSRRGASHHGSRSMCGTQVLSQKSSSPSFSFGSSPARVSLHAHKSSRPMILQASVSESMITPGPIYKPSVTSKWLGDAPVALFGKEKQRPAAATHSSDISSFTGKSNLPGPGTYGAQSSIGPQSLTRCSSHAAYTFGNAKQHEQAAAVALSPGPIYRVEEKLTKKGRQLKAAYSFGSEVRCGSSTRASTPGPGMYNSRSSLGFQGDSQMRSGPQRVFGNSVDRGVYVDVKASPGPIYAGERAACSNQTMSARRSAPIIAFPRAQRFQEFGDLNPDYARSTPGPGDYLI